jgi:hypothetical protein
MLGAIAVGAVLALVGIIMVVPAVRRTLKRAMALTESPVLLTLTSLEAQTERLASSAQALPRLSSRASAAVAGVGAAFKASEERQP